MVSTNKDDFNVLVVPVNMHHTPFINTKCVERKFVNSTSFKWCF